MEKYCAPVRNLLFKFSNAHLVLIYYNEVIHAQWLMNMLCKRSRDWWNNNYKAFWNAFEYMRKKLEYICEFDEQFAEYLLNQSRYNFYQLTITTHTAEGINALMDKLIKEVPNPCNLKFDKIKLTYQNHEDVKIYNMLYNLFLLKNMDPSWLELEYSGDHNSLTMLQSLQINKVEYASSIQITMKDITTVIKILFRNKTFSSYLDKNYYL